MIKLKDKTREFYNKSAAAYLDRNFHRIRVDVLRKFIKLLPERRRILDMGCSVGRDLMWLKANGVKDVYGIDFAEEMIKIASRYVQATLKVMDIAKPLEFETDFFNGIVCLGTLGNVVKKKAPKIMKEMYRVIRPSGVVVITVKEGDREYLEITNKYGVEYMNLPRHISLYRQGELNNLLSEAGFQIIESRLFLDDNFNWVISYARKVRG